MHHENCFKGRIFAFGSNQSGQLGRTNLQKSSIPLQVDFGEGERKMFTMASGFYHSVNDATFGVVVDKLCDFSSSHRKV